ncbi:MAG: MaoC family dehydratase [Dehalococcoidia bacterium]
MPRYEVGHRVLRFALSLATVGGMTAQRYFEDFQIGERFKAPSRTLTDAHFLFFAGMTGDNHPIHYDEEYAKATPFGHRLAHGLLLTSLTALGAGSLSAQVEESMIGFLEQSARFLKPVFIGDTISPELEVAELIPKRNGCGIVRLTSRLRNQHGEIVLEGAHVYLVRSRQPEQSTSEAGANDR